MAVTILSVLFLLLQLVAYNFPQHVFEAKSVSLDKLTNMYNMICFMICAFMAVTISAIVLPHRAQDLLTRDTSLEEIFASPSNHINHTYHEAWCFWQQNPFTQSWAVIFPHDGSPTEDGLDPKCKCGGLFEKKLRAKAFAITDW